MSDVIIVFWHSNATIILDHRNYDTMRSDAIHGTTVDELLNSFKDRRNGKNTNSADGR